MFPLLLMGAIGAGVGIYENKAASEAADLEPKVMGVNMQTAGTIAGLAMLLIGGPLMAPLGLSLAVASVTSKDAMTRAKNGLDQIIASAVQRQLAANGAGGGAQPPAPPALPGPAAGAQGGWFANLIQQGAGALQQNAAAAQ